MPSGSAAATTTPVLSGVKNDASRVTPISNSWEITPPAAPVWNFSHYSSTRGPRTNKNVDSTFTVGVTSLAFTSDEKVYLRQAIGSAAFSGVANQYEKPVLLRLLNEAKKTKGTDWTDLRITSLDDVNASVVLRKSVSVPGVETSAYATYLEDYKLWLKFMKGFDKREDRSLVSELRAANDKAAAAKVKKPIVLTPANPTSKRSLAKAERAAKKLAKETADKAAALAKNLERERLLKLKKEAEAVHEKKIVELAAAKKLQEAENSVAKITAARSKLIAKTDFAVEPVLDIEAGWKLTTRKKKPVVQVVENTAMLVPKGGKVSASTVRKQTVH